MKRKTIKANILGFPSIKIYIIHGIRYLITNDLLTTGKRETKSKGKLNDLFVHKPIFQTQNRLTRNSQYLKIKTELFF